MENEENRDLINKKAYEDQWERLGQFSFGALSLLFLSLSHTLGYLEFSWSTLALEQERKRRQEEAKIKQGKVGSSNYIKFSCRYRVACMISSLILVVSL